MNRFKKKKKCTVKKKTKYILSHKYILSLQINFLTRMLCVCQALICQSVMLRHAGKETKGHFLYFYFLIGCQRRRGFTTLNKLLLCTYVYIVHKCIVLLVENLLNKKSVVALMNYWLNEAFSELTNSN